ncbi:MAG TPA: PBP1A family penicillin-binding protein [Candidatus Dormibacteraeota bacterium]|nr:PBP1A family penicillin-binding protein [Candidatus Dormibacteraeota bacterium]
MRYVVAGLLIALVVFVVGLTGTVVAMTRGLPSLSSLEKKPLGRTTFVYDRDGRLIAQLHGATNRVPVASGRIPTALKDATVAIEDKRFYQDHGVDFRAIARAVVADLVAGRVVQGASTITEQYIKNAYLGDQQTLQRKIREAWLAWQLAGKWSKDRILTAYLNTVYYGQGAYGVQAAAETFFHRPASRLSLAQSALLAGLPRDPTGYSPIFDPADALSRRNLVLQQMQQQGYITARQVRHAEHARLRVYRTAPSTQNATADYFVEYVTQQLVQRYGASRVYEGGLRVYTTLDLGWQRAAIDAVRSTLNQPGDPASAVVTIDPKTGFIRAMVGGLDYKRQQFNLAYQARRQPGSAMKPFVLAAAIEQGADPATTFYDSHPLHITFPNGAPPWDVTTFDGTAYGPSNLVQATVRSDNTVYAQLALDVGPKNIVRVAHRMGITTPLKAVPSIALGSQVVNPLEMATAYATFADLGVRHAPLAITRVVADGHVDYTARPKGTRVIPAGVAYVVDKILEQNVQVGTGVAAQLPGRPVAGKTGTTSNFVDAWFCGFTPNLTSIVWVGYPQNETTSMYAVHGIQVVGGSFPAIIWHAYMATALNGLPAIDFTQPAVMPTYKPWHGKYAIGGPLAPSIVPSQTPAPLPAATPTAPQSTPKAANPPPANGNGNGNGNGAGNGNGNGQG